MTSYFGCPYTSRHQSHSLRYHPIDQPDLFGLLQLIENFMTQHID